MFRTELRKFGRLYQLSATISRPKVAGGDEIASWTIETKADDWQTRTDYDFLRFEDFIQRDLAAPIWRTVFQAVWIYWRLMFSGTIARFAKANWRFATFITYPHLVLLLEAAVRRRRRLCVRKGPGRARHSRPLQHRGGDRDLRRPARHRAEIHGKPHLCALSPVRHDLDLGVLAPPAPGMGSAHRPLCAAPRQGRARERRRGNRHRRPQFGIVSGDRDPGARA